ncbi:hypothetical protein G6F50_013561 [Rhizopus delemar]|uniref:Uncharacterized protein n=1 Tax=Rhizopus delemar TaxID=936053 RepID=A0A9P7CDG3_9FUNG|nr:hypothetical protein G6F50_013561 [Rhizopus delemar]
MGYARWAAVSFRRITRASPILRAPGAEHDYQHAGQAQAHAEPVACAGAHAVAGPQPQQRHADVHAAIRGVDPAGCGRMQGQQPREQGQAGRRQDTQDRHDATPGLSVRSIILTRPACGTPDSVVEAAARDPLPS